MSLVDDLNATIDELITWTTGALDSMAANGLDREQAVMSLIGSFLVSAAHAQPTAGARHYAVALVRLADDARTIARLTDELEMHRELLRMQDGGGEQ